MSDLDDIPAIDISDIWSPPTIDDVRTLLLPFLTTDENPVTDWHSGAILRTMYELEAFVIQDLVANMLPGIFANGYPDTDDDASLDLIGHGFFGSDRVSATFATQTITLACDATHGPYTIATDRWYLTSDGALYQGLAGGTLGTSSTLAFDVAATSAGAARGLVNQLLSKLPGVTVQSAVVKVVGGVAQFGSDKEPNATYRARLNGRFPDLTADPPVRDRFEQWALNAGTSTTRARLYADPAVPGASTLVLANNTGGIPGGEVTTVQNYVRARTFDDVTAVSASNASVTAGGVVLYPAAWTPAQLTAAKTAADNAWAAALATNQIGAHVTLSSLNRAVMDQGAIDFTNKMLNGAANDLMLASGQVPVAAGSLAAELTWSPY